MANLTELKLKHEQLRRTFEEQPHLVRAASEEDKAKVVALLNAIQKASAEVTTLEDYEWLRGSFDRWRSVMVNVFNNPPQVDLLPPGAPLSPPARVYSEHLLEELVRTKAWELAKERAVKRVLTLSPEELLRRFGSTPKDAEEDWNNAAVYFASQIIAGDITLKQLQPASYCRLERCWLEDVKQVMAYYNWLRGGGGSKTRPEQEQDYLPVCEKLKSQLAKVAPVLSASDFEPVQEYLESHFFSAGKLDLGKAECLIAAKAQRIWEVTGRSDRLRNWFCAADYVRDFYGSIIPAVSKGKPEAIDQVMRSLGSNPFLEGRHLVINCFEMALALQFCPRDSTGSA